MVRGLVPSMSDMSVDFHSGNGGTRSVTKNTQPGVESHSDMVRGLVPSMVRCKG